MATLHSIFSNGLSINPTQWALVAAGVFTAYVIFGMAGFGTALVAGPVLAQVLPVSQIVPLLALLDCAAALGSVTRDLRSADTAELRRLLPFMLVGSGLGAGILLNGRPDILLLALGIFAVAYAVYTLSGLKPHKGFSPNASRPFGLIGGVFSALFGSGGFIYAIYLSGRLNGKDQIRVTQAALIGVSTLTRLVLFGLAGVYADGGIWMLALLGTPLMLVGTALGRRITLRLSREQFLKVVSGVVLVSGVLLIVRYFTLE